MNLWLCGIAGKGSVEDLKIATQAWEYFDGLQFVHDGDKQVIEVLEARKKEGSVIYRKWSNDFDLQKNEFLRNGNMKRGDWFIITDTPEVCTAEFAQDLRNFHLRDFERSNIHSVWQASKPLLLEYNNDLLFVANPHNGMVNCQPNFADIEQMGLYKNRKEYFYSRRVGDESFVKNALKYYFYPRTNHLQLVYLEPQRFPNLNGEQVKQNYQKHMETRDWFINRCHIIFGIEPTVESVTEYMQKPDKEWDKAFKEYVAFEYIFSMHYRWKVLNEKPLDILANWNTWSLNQHFKDLEELKDETI